MTDNKGAYSIAIANPKGGVGKTTVSTTLSHILAVAGYKVLLCDLDEQGSATQTLKAYPGDLNEKLPTSQMLRINFKKEGRKPLNSNEIINLNIFDLLTQPANINNYIFLSQFKNLHIIPNARNLGSNSYDMKFDDKFAKVPYAGKHKAFLSNLNKVRHEYDFIIIDTQPGDTHLLDIALSASDFVLTPTLNDIKSVAPPLEMGHLINRLNEELNLNIEYLGFFLNNVNTKEESYTKIRNFFSNNENFIDIPVRTSQTVYSAGNKGYTLLEYMVEKKLPTIINPLQDLFLLATSIGILSEDAIKNLLRAGVKERHIVTTLEILNQK